MKIKTIFLSILGIFILSPNSFSQSSYEEYINYYKDYDFSQRKAPKIPPKGEKLNIIIDADAKNESGR